MIDKTNLALRQSIRANELRETTAGLAPEFVQANMAILPKKYADDFLRFCQANPKPCPLIAVGEAGRFDLSQIAEGLDIRTDLPAYHVYHDGVLSGTPDNIHNLWQDDFVVFLLGCSFSFEQGLLDNGIPLKHHSDNKNVAMYNTNIVLQSSGVFGGNMVVSMRPMTASNAIRAVQVTTSMPRVHGAPIHLGDPELIGIDNVCKPDYGDAVDINNDELPVFWACGVTAIAAVKAAKIPLAITHSPGCMLITDMKNYQLSF